MDRLTTRVDTHYVEDILTDIDAINMPITWHIAKDGTPPSVANSAE